MKSYNSSQFLLSAIQIALEAGDLLKQGFGTSFTVKTKPGHHNIVTNYDQQSEEMIFSFVSSQFPSHGFLGEEEGMVKQSDVMWIVDPLDGTFNFAHTIPLFSVSIAVAVHQEVVVCCIYLPILGELFWAEKGKGAFLNGKKIHVSTASDLKKAFLAYAFSYQTVDNSNPYCKKFLSLLQEQIPFRRFGAASIDLAYIASGRLDGFCSMEIQPWDFAAGKLLIEEAQGKVTMLRQNSTIFDPSPLLASNPYLHPQLVEMLT